MDDDVLDDGAPGGVDELRSIVARVEKLRWRAAGLAAAVTLLVGGGVGYAVSNHSSSKGTQTLVAGAGSPSGGAAGSAAAPETASGQAVTPGGVAVFPSPLTAVKYTHLFTRTSGPVTIRGFEVKNQAFPEIAPAAEQPCGAPVIGTSFVAEVSTLQMVGTVSTPGYSTASEIKWAQAQVVGTAEGDPIGVLTVQTSSAVTQVLATFVGGGTDQMAPVDGRSALAAPVSPAEVSSGGRVVATIKAVGSTGTVLQSMTVHEGFVGGPPIMTPATSCGCRLQPPIASVPPNAPQPGSEGTGGGGASGSASGSGVSGSASTGSGTASTGSGTASTGSAPVGPPTPLVCQTTNHVGTAHSSKASSSSAG